MLWKRVEGTTASYERTVKSFIVITEFSLLHGLESAYSCAKVYLNEEELNRDEIDSFVESVKAFIEEEKMKEIEAMKCFINELKK